MKWKDRKMFYRNVPFAERLLRRVNWIALIVLMGIWVMYGWRVAVGVAVGAVAVLLIVLAFYTLYAIRPD